MGKVKKWMKGLKPQLNTLDVSSSSSQHPKCKGWYKNDWGMVDGPDWGCDYNTIIDCDECKYGGGRKDPEAKCNQDVL
jgi:hypothetical protein